MGDYEDGGKMAGSVNTVPTHRGLLPVHFGKGSPHGVSPVTVLLTFMVK